MRKKLLAAVFAILICVSTAMPVFGSGISVHRGYQGSGGITLNYITISGSNCRPQIILAHGAINNAENVDDILERAKSEGNVLAAFVGTFFQASNGTNITDGFLLQDGQVVNPGWFHSYLIFGTDGKWRIMDRSEMDAFGRENIVTAVANDPRFIRDGQKSLEPGVMDSAFMNSAAQRTLVGVKADGSLLVATGAANYNNAADTLLGLGCIDAMSMDGGASSFLYAEGTVLQQAGRNLNNIIVIYEVSEHQIANPTAAPVFINKERKSFEAYNIGGSNYFKLRDLAYALNGTEKQFGVSWDSAANAVNLLPGQTYISDGNDLVAGDGAAKTAVPAAGAILLNGTEIGLNAFNISGNNFFMLRDIGRIFDFAVEWDDAENSIAIDTSKPYGLN